VRSLILFLMAGLAIAAEPASALPAGEYLMKDGEATLVIKADQTFTIDTIGTNAHTCNFRGKVSTSPIRIDDSACYLSFKLRDVDVLVSAENRYAADDESGCSSFCGLRAAFDGGMFYSLPKCTQGSVANVRREFKLQFDRKEYATAKQTLTKLLSQCEHVLHWSLLDWLRNDLALTQYRTGDAAACLETLKPLHDLSSMSDEEVGEIPEPTFVDIYLRIARATRTNLKLCNAAVH
jgi:hypothetical protein